MLRRRALLPLVVIGFVPLLLGLISWSSLGGRDAQQSSQPDSIDAAWFEEYPRHDPLSPKELEELTLGVWKQVSTKSPLQRAPQAYAFRTQSAFFDGTSYHPLYRGHRTYGELTPSLLLEAATLAGAYLTRSVDGQGRFVYLYDAAQDRQSEEYNVLRHAGAVYAMLELYPVTRDQALLEVAGRALEYLVAQIRPCTLDAMTYHCLVENDEIKVGGHGLALLALSPTRALRAARSISA